MSAIGHGNSTGFLQAANLAHQFPGKALGNRGHRGNPHQGRVPRPAQDEIHNRRIINYRLCVWHHDHGGDTTRRSSLGSRGQRLAVFRAGFAGEHAHVDKAGNKCRARAIKTRRSGPDRFLRHIRANRQYPAILNEDAPLAVQALGRGHDVGIQIGLALR